MKHYLTLLKGHLGFLPFLSFSFLMGSCYNQCALLLTCLSSGDNTEQHLVAGVEFLLWGCNPAAEVR